MFLSGEICPGASTIRVDAVLLGRVVLTGQK